MLPGLSSHCKEVGAKLHNEGLGEQVLDSDAQSSHPHHFSSSLSTEKNPTELHSHLPLSKQTGVREEMKTPAEHVQPAVCSCSSPYFLQSLLCGEETGVVKFRDT